MSPLARPHPTTEGRSGSRIDLEGGGCYLGIPRNRPVRAFTGVQRTGCGTWSANDSELEPTIGDSLASALQSEQRRVEHITYPPFGENGHSLFAHPEGRKVFSRDLLRFLDTHVLR